VSGPTDEWLVEIAAMAIASSGGDPYDAARAALTAVAPLLRGRALEEAAEVAWDVAGEGAEQADGVAAAIRVARAIERKRDATPPPGDPHE
jgi:hypothetical protein